MSLESRHLMPEGINFFKKTVENHTEVRRVSVKDVSFYKAIGTIYRYAPKPIVKTYIADVYVLTASDVNEIISKYSDIDCIVVISNWDHYTDLAKNNAKKYGVGVFTLNEFLVALNYDGRKFLDTGVARKTE